MTHFAHDLLAADPDALSRLKQVLHGEETAPAPAPSLAERFGGLPAAASPRKPRRRRQAATAGSLVTP